MNEKSKKKWEKEKKTATITEPNEKRVSNERGNVYPFESFRCAVAPHLNIWIFS